MKRIQALGLIDLYPSGAANAVPRHAERHQVSCK